MRLTTHNIVDIACQIRMPSLRRYHASWIRENAVVFFVGSRGSGKTCNIIDLFYHKRNDFAYGVIFCGSTATIREYERHFPSTFIYYNYCTEVLRDLLEDQERKVYEGRANPVFVLIDDCTWAKRSITADPTFIRLMNNGRHAKIFLAISMQYSTTIPPELRQQVDVVYFNREKNPKNRERLYENFNPCFESFGEWDACFKACTLNHESFVVDNRSANSDKIEDNVFWYKSKYVPGGRHFRVNRNGKWWLFHKLHYNPKHYMQSQEDPTDKKGKKKRAVTTRVQKEA